MTSLKKDIGDSGEQLAAKYLQAHGFQILDRNVVTSYGEIDLIARKKKHLYFIEIKTRRSQTYGTALDAVTPQKIKKINRIAQSLLMRNRDWQKMIPFLSVIAIDQKADGKYSIEFLPDAYDA